MSSLSPFVSSQNRCLAPSNMGLLVERLAQLPLDQFKDMALQMQWDELVTAPQCMEIDGMVQVINKQVLSPLQYAILALPPERLEWLLPRALAATRKQSHYYRNDEGLIHANDLVDTLLPTAISTTNKKKIDIVLGLATPEHDHQIMRMSSDEKVAIATEHITPDAALPRIPAMVRHMVSLLHKRILADPMFRNRPRDARRMAQGIGKNFMTAFAIQGRQEALDAAYPPGRRIPLKVWEAALSNGGLVKWCADRIRDISFPGPSERGATSDWSQRADACPVMLVVSAAHQAQAMARADFITPAQRNVQHQWTIRAIDVMTHAWSSNGVPDAARRKLWGVLGQLPHPAAAHLAAALDTLHAARPDEFAKDWQDTAAGEMAAWINAGHFKLAAQRAKAFPGTMSHKHATELSSRLFVNWLSWRTNARSGTDKRPVADLADQVLLHQAWGISPGSRELLAASSQGPSRELSAEFDQFMLKHRTRPAPPRAPARRI